MKKMFIYEPAMCCSTGLCGVGVDGLPVTVLDDEIVLTGRYPTNEEFVTLLNIPMSFLGEQPKTVKVTPKRSGGCGCSGGRCC
jgi:hypothetical protein